MPDILIIDDDKLITTLLEDTLQKHNYKTITAHDGHTGIDLAHANIPDLILLDFTMPKMDGNEVLKTLRSANETKAIPIIMLTAKSDNKDISTSLQLGAADYIVKPFDPENMLRRVERLLNRAND